LLSSADGDELGFAELMVMNMVQQMVMSLASLMVLS